MKSRFVLKFLDARMISAISLFALLLTMPLSSAWAVPTLWGIDGDDGSLFSIGNYATPSTTLTMYGKLKYNNGGTLTDVGKEDLEAFTLAPDGTAYFAFNNNVGGINKPVLGTFNISTVSPGTPVIVTLLGRIQVPFDNSNDNISGLAFQPTTNELYALFRDNGGETTDKLLKINRSTGAVISTQTISGLSQKVTKGEDLAFSLSGLLYVTDNDDDHLYQVDPLTGAIIAVLDNNEKGGLGVDSVKFEGLAWDPENSKLIGVEDNYNLFAYLTISNGSNTSFGSVSGLTDVEAIAFVPTGAVATPEPATLLLLGSGLIGVAGYARRKFKK